MASPLRIEYLCAIHHMMVRGNFRRSAFEREPAVMTPAAQSVSKLPHSKMDMECGGLPTLLPW
jgi:hypothetical protein